MTAPAARSMISVERAHHGEWTACEFEELRVGDLFRVVFPPGAETVHYTALSNPQPIPEQPGNWSLRTERAELATL